MQEIRSHTLLRGIAALLVVSCHYRLIVKSHFDVDAYTQFFARGYQWVDCFFILSGFILSYVYGTKPASSSGLLFKFLEARFARIYPLHLATLAFFLLLMAIPSIRHQPIDIPWGHFWLNVFDIHGWGFLGAFDFNFPSWSISVEFAAYLLFPILCLGLIRLRRTTISLMMMALVIRLCFTALFESRSEWERIVVLQGLPIFMSGILIFQLRNLANTLSDHTLAMIQVGALIFVVLSMHFGLNDANSDVAFAAIVFASQTDKGLIIWLPFEKLGKWSYSIYMLHIPILAVLQLVWPKLGAIPLRLSDSSAAWGLASSSLVVTIFSGYLSFEYFEMPVRNWFTSPDHALAHK